MGGVGASWRFAKMMELLIDRKASPRVGGGALTVTVVLVLGVGVIVFWGGRGEGAVGWVAAFSLGRAEPRYL